MTFMRVSRDQRGYETTYLFHTPRPGDRPRVLYWFRTAPGVRVGRRALDEDAIRAIEEQHPDIEFDWPTLLDEAQSLEPEVDKRPERPRRKRPPEGEPVRPLGTANAATPARALGGAPAAGSAVAPAAPVTAASAPAAPAATERTLPADPTTAATSQSAERGGPRAPAAAAGGAGSRTLLEQLVGREIATRLRARYAEVCGRLSELPDDAARAAWQQRADALNPDRWDTPDAVLNGIQHADRLFDALKREFPANQ